MLLQTRPEAETHRVRSCRARCDSGGRLHHRAVLRQSGGGRSRRRWTVRRGDAALRALDQPVRNDIRAAAGVPRGRLPATHIHSGAGTAVFAGHPTLGTCHAWLEGRRGPAPDDAIVQDAAPDSCPSAARTRGCRSRRRLSCAGPGRRRACQARLARMLGIEHSAMTDTQWVDNDRAGSRSCSTTRRRCSPSSRATTSSTSASSRISAPARPRRSRSARSPTRPVPSRRVRSRAGLNASLAGGSHHRPGERALHRPPRHRARPAGVSTSRRIRTEPSGSAAARSRACAAGSTSRWGRSGGVRWRSSESLSRARPPHRRMTGRRILGPEPPIRDLSRSRWPRRRREPPPPRRTHRADAALTRDGGWAGCGTSCGARRKLARAVGEA